MLKGVTQKLFGSLWEASLCHPDRPGDSNEAKFLYSFVDVAARNALEQSFGARTTDYDVPHRTAVLVFLIMEVKDPGGKLRVPM